MNCRFVPLQIPCLFRLEGAAGLIANEPVDINIVVFGLVLRHEPSFPSLEGAVSHPTEVPNRSIAVNLMNPSCRPVFLQISNLLSFEIAAWNITVVPNDVNIVNVTLVLPHSPLVFSLEVAVWLVTVKVLSFAIVVPFLVLPHVNGLFCLVVAAREVAVVPSYAHAMNVTHVKLQRIKGLSLVLASFHSAREAVLARIS